MAYVYQIRSQKTGSSYIGGTLNYKIRRGIHKSLLRHNKHENKLLQNHVNIYGLDDFEWIILEECRDNDITKREQFYTDILNNDFNIRKIVHANFGLKHTIETKRKMSKARKWLSLDARKNYQLQLKTESILQNRLRKGE